MGWGWGQGERSDAIGKQSKGPTDTKKKRNKNNQPPKYRKDDPKTPKIRNKN